MKQIYKVISVILLVVMLSSTFAYASASAQSALAIQKLALRSGPSTKTDELGTFKVAGQYIELSAKSWDSVNSIWWVKCSFSYNGSRITGWTGAKRFDSSTYNLGALPETSGASGGSKSANKKSDSAFGNAYSALATMPLSLRSGPSNKTEDLGTYNMQGKYAKLIAKAWDSVNNIWWLKCSFSYNGSYVTGWTGAKRFDSSTYSLDALPQESESYGGKTTQSSPSIVCSLMNDVDFYSYYPDFETWGLTAVGSHVNEDGTWTWQTYFETGDGISLWVLNCNDFVSLRKEASSSSERLIRVTRGAEVWSLGYINGWVLCEYNGECGWIMSDYLCYQ